MSVSSALDQTVTSRPFFPTSDDDPVARLFVDHTFPGERRLLAIAEPVHRTTDGYLAASAALAAFEEAFGVSLAEGVETALVRAFGAANAAICAANRSTTMLHQRAFAGITAVVMEGSDATIGCIPPGQSLILQDGHLYAVPELASWAPNFMPTGECESPDPLGVAAVVVPQLRRTRIRPGDQVVLGSSAVGRALANEKPGTERELDGAVGIDRLERALESTGVSDAYAAWVRVDPTPAPRPLSAERLAELEAQWKGRPVTRPAQEIPSELPSDPRLRRAEKLDRFHTRLIEASERFLGRRQPEYLPLDAHRRTEAIPVAGALQRHVPSRRPSLGPSLRCRLPRGPRLRISKGSLLGLFLVMAVLGAAAFGYDVRQASADKQDRYLGTAKEELELANAATSPDDVRRHLDVARRALDDAAEHGADRDEVAGWRALAAQVEDRLNGVNRIKSITRIGTLPEGFLGERPRLVFAGERLYLIADGVYAVDAASLSLIQVLREGERIDGFEVGPIIEATAEGAELLVTDGAALFRRTAAGRWSGERLASVGEPERWPVVASGAFQGSFYVLEMDASPQIKKFGAKRLDHIPENWLADDAVAEIANGVDMVVDGSIHVLTADGEIRTFYRGNPRSTFTIDAAAPDATFVGLNAGSLGSFLYAVEVADDAARLIRYDQTANDATPFLLPDPGHPGYDPAAAAAVAATIDFAVDEMNGVVYFVTPDGLWRGTLS